MKKRSFGARLCLALCATLAVQTARSDTMVLCMGDSITKGYGVNIPYPTRLTSNTGYSTVNAGVGGVRTGYGLSIVDSLLAQYNPLNVLIMYGTNDANDPNQSMSDSADVVIQIAQRVRAYGAYPVIGTIPPQIGPRAYNMSRVRQFNGYLRTRAAANGFALADIEAAFGSGSGLFNSDGFHPNDSGAELIAQTFAPKVQVLSLSPTSTQVADVGVIGRTFSVVTPLSWTATANQPWITIISGATGTGNGTVMFNVAGQVGPARSGTIRVTSGSFSRTFTVNQSASPSLTVASRYGTPLPGAGTYWLEAGTPISASIADSPVLIGVSTQYVCTGWTGTGSAPASGTNQETGTFTVMNASSVIWLWKTNYWLELTPTEGGTITVPSGWYPRGSNVVVRAVPDAGYKFVRWTGPYNTTAETFYATMTASKSFLATFALATNSLTVSSRYGTPVPAGTTWMRKDTVTNASVDSPVMVGATTQYVCTGWTGTGSAPASGTGTDTGPFGLANNSTVAWLWKTNYWLETAAQGSGTVSVASAWFPRGTNVTIQAIPDPGYRFVRWTGVPNSFSPTVTVSMTAAQSLAAEFNLAPAFSRKVNCGGTAQAGDWVADTGYSGGTAKSTTAAMANATNAPDAVYQTRRYATTLTYSFADVPDGTYTIRLHFAELYSNAAGQRRFNVAIEGQTQLTNFDIFQEAGGKNRAVVKTFENVAVSGGLQIQGVASADSAQFNGIEIESEGPPAPAIVTSVSQLSVAEGATATFGVHLAAAPASATTVSVARASGDTDLTVSGGASLVFTAANYAVDQTVTLAAAEDADTTGGTAAIQCTASGYTAASVTATEQDNDSPPYALKVNCGGAVLAGDWVADTGFSGGTARSTTAAIANATNAPQAAYQARRNAPTLTYSFADVPDGTYTIRLHFAELYAKAAGQRIFNVAIEGETKLTGFDIYQEAGGGYRAVVKTFENVVVSGGLQIQGVASVDSAQFNGIEILAGGGAGGKMTKEKTIAAPTRRMPDTVLSSEEARIPGAGWAAVDGDLDTTWQAAGNQGSWICLGYAAPVEVQAVDVQFAPGSPLGVFALASDDARDWFELEPELELGPVTANYFWFLFPAAPGEPPPAVREIEMNPAAP